MSLELVFNALAAIVWPIFNLLLSVFGILAVVLVCAAIAAWRMMRTHNPRPAARQDNHSS